MPIQFPRPTGPVRSVVESQWLRQATKSFDAVPAPNTGRPGAPFSVSALGGASGWSLDPGIGIMRDGTRCGAGGAAGNVRRPGPMFQAPDQTARVNPAGLIDELYDEVNGFDRTLGEQNERIVGVSYDASGSPLGGCTVKVFRTADDVLVGSTVSDGSGNWTVYPNQPGPYYFVEYLAGSPDVFGTSPNTNTSTQFTPGS